MINRACRMEKACPSEAADFWAREDANVDIPGPYVLPALPQPLANSHLASQTRRRTIAIVESTWDGSAAKLSLGCGKLPSTGAPAGTCYKVVRDHTK